MLHSENLGATIFLEKIEHHHGEDKKKFNYKTKQKVFEMHTVKGKSPKEIIRYLSIY